ASSGKQGQSSCHLVCGCLQPLLASRNGSIVGQVRPKAPVGRVYSACSHHRVSGTSVVSSGAVFLSIARGRTVAVISLRKLQRSNGCLSYRDYACGSTDSWFFSCL